MKSCFLLVHPASWPFHGGISKFICKWVTPYCCVGWIQSTTKEGLFLLFLYPCPPISLSLSLSLTHTHLMLTCTWIWRFGKIILTLSMYHNMSMSYNLKIIKITKTFLNCTCSLEFYKTHFEWGFDDIFCEWARWGTQGRSDVMVSKQLLSPLPMSLGEKCPWIVARRDALLKKEAKQHH